MGSYQVAHTIVQWITHCASSCVSFITVVDQVSSVSLACFFLVPASAKHVYSTVLASEDGMTARTHNTQVCVSLHHLVAAHTVLASEADMTARTNNTL